MEKVRKNERSKFESKKGITLVALVVTIIILLILAGISISTLTGSGLFEKAKLAKERTEERQRQEEQFLADYENKIGEYINSNRDTTKQNSENTMSGTEHFIGEYYMDGKPIYAKTFYIASLPNKASKNYNHQIANVDKIWYDVTKSYVINNNSGTSPIPFVHVGSFDGQIALYIARTEYFQIGTGKDRSDWSAYITLNYTKTTDQATITPSITTLTPAN